MSARPTSGPKSPSSSRSDPASIAKGLFPHQVEGVAFLLRRRRAINLLRETHVGPQVRKFMVQSNSGRGTYELVVDASGDIQCLCPGFGYRGTCSHARKLGEGMVGGGGKLKGSGSGWQGNWYQPTVDQENEQGP